MWIRALVWLRGLLWSAPAVVFLTAVMATLLLCRSAFNRQRGFLRRWRLLWARFILAAGFVRTRASGLDRLDPSQTYIFCPNHLSYLDPPVMLALLPQSVRFLAKKSLFSIPFLGWAMRLAGDIPVKRGRPQAAAPSLAEASRLLRQGTSLVIFPEGGRSLDGHLQRFRSGAFRLAIELQLPVVPVAVQGTREALPPGSLCIRGGEVQLLLAEPIPTTGLTRNDRTHLARQAEAAVRDLLQAAPSTRSCAG